MGLIALAALRAYAYNLYMKRFIYLFLFLFLFSNAFALQIDSAINAKLDAYLSGKHAAAAESKNTFLLDDNPQDVLEKILKEAPRQKNDAVPQIIHRLHQDAFHYAILVKDDSSQDAFCSGTILQDGWVLSAGHCLRQCINQKCMVLAASHNDKFYPNLTEIKFKTDFFIPKKYLDLEGNEEDLSFEATQYDIALLKVPGLKAKEKKEIILLPQDKEPAWEYVILLTDDNDEPANIINRGYIPLIETVYDEDLEENVKIKTLKTFSGVLVGGDYIAVEEKNFDIPVVEGDSGSALYTPGGKISAVSSRVHYGSMATFVYFAPMKSGNYNFIMSTIKNNP